MKLPRAILIVNPIASAKDAHACDSCNVWRVIENPQFAFRVLIAGMFRAVVVDDLGADVERPMLAAYRPTRVHRQIRSNGTDV